MDLQQQTSYQDGEKYNISNPTTLSSQTSTKGAPAQSTPPSPVTSTPGHTGFCIVILTCKACVTALVDRDKEDISSIQVVPSTGNSCENIASNSGLCSGIAFPPKSDSQIYPSWLLSSGHNNFLP